MLFVVGNPVLNVGDAAVKSRLEASGYIVTVVDDGASSTSNAEGKDLVVVSSTCTSTSVNKKFKDVAVPVITWESEIYDDMKMTGTIRSDDYKAVAGQTKVQITDPSHPLAAGLSGIVTVISPEYVSSGLPSNDCSGVASLSQDPDMYVIYGYEAGATMVGMNAPARRVGFFLSDISSSTLTTDGWALFDAAVSWSVGTETSTPTSVQNPPEAAFSAGAVSGTAPLKVTFMDESINSPDSWSWDFGDEWQANEQNPSHTYTEPGTYTVTLEVTNADGSDITTKIDYISVDAAEIPVEPVAAFDADCVTGPAPLQVTFTDLSEGKPDSWTWYFGDGEATLEQAPTHTYSQPGTYRVTLVVINEEGIDFEQKSGFITVTDE